MLKIKKREATLKDFLKVKKLAPWADWRQVAKTINFSLLFGCSAGTFASMLDMQGFTEEEADELIHDAHLEKRLRNIMEDPKNFSRGQHYCKMYVCADFMKENFFRSYVGLESRLEREVAFAIEHGYVRAWNGPVRHLPEYLLMKFNEKGNLCGNDKNTYSKQASLIKNMAGNTTIQTLEAAVAFPALHEICSYIREWKLKSFVFNTIHDSIDLCIWIPEEELILALVSTCMTKFRYFDHGIPMECDCDLVKMDDLETHFYKHGVGVKFVEIQEALRRYNEMNGTSLSYDPKKYL